MARKDGKRLSDKKARKEHKNARKARQNHKYRWAS